MWVSLYKDVVYDPQKQQQFAAIRMDNAVFYRMVAALTLSRSDTRPVQTTYGSSSTSKRYHPAPPVSQSHLTSISAVGHSLLYASNVPYKQYDQE